MEQYSGMEEGKTAGPGTAWQKANSRKRLPKCRRRKNHDPKKRGGKIMITDEQIKGLVNGTVDKEGLTKKDWRLISLHRGLPENFVQKYEDKVEWWQISVYQQLSEDFVRRYADRVDWMVLSGSNPMSESFMREFADWLDWRRICIYKRLSEDFMRNSQTGWTGIML